MLNFDNFWNDTEHGFDLKNNRIRSQTSKCLQCIVVEKYMKNAKKSKFGLTPRKTNKIKCLVQSCRRQLTQQN